MPLLHSVLVITPHGAELKTFLTSNSRSPTMHFASRPSPPMFITRAIALVVDVPRLNPYWFGVSNWLLSHIAFSLVSMTFSRSFPMTSSIDSGRYVLGFSKGWSFFLKRTSRARFHDAGKTPCRRHRLNTFTINSDRVLASNFTASPGIQSGPRALFPGMPWASFLTSVMVTGSTGLSCGHSQRVLCACVGNSPSMMPSILPGVLILGIGRLTPSLDITILYGFPHGSWSTSVRGSAIALPTWSSWPF